MPELTDRSSTEEASISQRRRTSHQRNTLQPIERWWGVDVAALIFAFVVLQAALRSETSSELLPRKGPAYDSPASAWGGQLAERETAKVN
ncbi:hypothetical protein MT1_1279 [Pseudomonas sp. MT-1]|nr:hypothetical protein MT1_1279 [Pseudomonas sp. MT-1]